MQKTSSKPIWSHPPEVLDLQPHQVDIWRISLDLPANSVKLLSSSLSVDETQRAARFQFPADKNRYIAAHGGLHDILARYLRCEPNKLNFSNNPYGKPALQDYKLEFNLSHSGDIALIAVSPQGKVGVDIERIRPGISSHVIARQYFSKSEIAELENLPGEQREAAFFTCWTRKEAYIKAQGQGLSLALESFDVSLTPDEPAILRATRPDSKEAARWKLLSPEITSRYATAVAVEVCQGLEFRLWDWNLL